MEKWTRMVSEGMESTPSQEHKTAPTGRPCVLCPSTVAMNGACKFLGHSNFFQVSVLPMAPSRQACMLEVALEEPGIEEKRRGLEGEKEGREERKA